MKKLLILLSFLFLSLIGNSQVPIEFNIHARGSDINGILGAEFKVGAFSIAEAWRPMMIKGVHSSVTSLTFYYPMPEYFKSSPYLTIGYSHKGFPYVEDRYLYLYGYYDNDDITFYPAIFILGGAKMRLKDIANNRIMTKAGMGIAIGEYGCTFSFEGSIHYALFKVN